jgi:topoisomerase-4 subunit A
MKRLAAGGRGLIVMGLEEGDSLAAVIVTNKSKLIVTAQAEKGREQVIRLSDADLQTHLGKRARMGKMLPLKPKSSVTQVTIGN